MAQLPDAGFSCKSRAILNWKNGAIPMCTDTLIIATDPPIARKVNNAYPRAATLHSMRMQNGELIRDAEIECLVLAEPPVQNVSLIFDHVLPAFDKDGALLVYEVTTYCGYWFGDSLSDTSTILFSMFPMYKAFAEARHVSSSTALPSEVLVSPVTMPSNGYPISNPFSIVALAKHGGLVFDHWTASHERIAFDKYALEQNISVACWPMAETVRFIAWYRDSTVSSVADSEMDEGASVVLYDLLGRRTPFEFRDSNRSTGLYMAVITTTAGVRFQPLLITN